VASPLTQNESADRNSCWCCGQEQTSKDMVHLRDHPEVEVCLRCAHYLHQQARGREDAQTRSPQARVRDGMRSVRGLMMRYDLQHKPVIGSILRWLGPRVP
jgi:ribosome-binding protein aMBF1 (putative translation factor)